MNEPPSRGDGPTRRAWVLGLIIAALLGIAALRVLPLTRPLPLETERTYVNQALDIEKRHQTGHESAEAVIATGGGFSVVGHTNSKTPGMRQAWVLQFDAARRLQWEHIHGSARATLGRAIASTSRGGVVVVGEEQVAPERFRGWLLALSPDGDVLWERTPGTEGINGLNAVMTLSDGSLVAGGVQERMGWVVRFTPRGELLWEVKLPQLEQVTALVASPERIAVVGTAESSTTGLGISRLLLLEPDGQVIQDRRLPAEGRGELVALGRLPDGGLVAAGRRSRAALEDWTLWVIGMSPQGDTRWEHVAEGPQVEAGRALTPTAGGLAVVGYSFKDMIDREAKVWSFSTEGQLLWQRSLGGAGEDLGHGIAQLADERLMIVGSTTSRGVGKTDLWMFQLSPQGERLWEETLGAE